MVTSIKLTQKYKYIVVATHALNIAIYLVFVGKWDDLLWCWHLHKWLRRRCAGVEDKWRPSMKTQAPSDTRLCIADRGDVVMVFDILVAY